MRNEFRRPERRGRQRGQPDDRGRRRAGLRPLDGRRRSRRPVARGQAAIAAAVPEPGGLGLLALGASAAVLAVAQRKAALLRQEG